MADAGATELSFILTLETGGMETVVTTLETQFKNIETSVSNIVQALSSIQVPAVPEIMEQWQQIADQIQNAPQINVPAPPANAAAAAVYPGGEWDEETQQIQDLTMAQLALKAQFTEHIDLIGPLLEGKKQFIEYSYEEQAVLLGILSLMSRMSPAWLKQNDITGEVADNYLKLLGRMHELKQVHQEAKVSQEKFNIQLGWMTKEVPQASTAISMLAGKVGLLAGALYIVTQLLQTINDEMNEFAKANYESVGSTIDLQWQVRGLETQFAATSAEAQKAISAVAMTGVHLDEGSGKFKEYTGRVMMLSRAYGVSEEASANLLARFDAMGASTEDAVGALDFAAKAISFAGLSAQESSQLVDRLNKSAWEAYAMYGSAQAAREFSDGMATMAAAARNAKVPLDEVLDVTQKIMKGGPEMIMALGGAAFNTTPAEKMATVMKKLPELMARVEAFPPEMREKVSQSLTGMTYTQIKAMSKIRDEIGDTQEAWDAYQKKIDEQKAVEENYREALQTLSGVMKQIFMPLISIATALLLPLAHAFVFLMKPITVLIRLLGQLMQYDVARYIIYAAAAVVGFTVAWNMLNLTVKASVIGLIVYGVAIAVEKLLNMGGWGTLAAGVLAVAAAFLLWKKNAWLANINTSQLAKRFRIGMRLLTRRLNAFSSGPLKTVRDKMDKFFKKGPEVKAPKVPKPAESKNFKEFMKNIRKGFAEFSRNPAATIKGALTFAAAVLIAGGAIVLLAGFAKLLGASADMLMVGVLAFIAVGVVMGFLGPLIAAGATALSAAAVPILIAAAVLGAAILILGAAIAGAMAMIAGAVEAGKGAGKMIGKTMEGIGDMVGGVLSGIGSAFKGLGEAVGDGIKDLFGQSDADKMEDMAEVYQMMANAFATAPNLEGQAAAIEKLLTAMQNMAGDTFGIKSNSWEIFSMVSQIADMDQEKLGKAADSMEKIGMALSSLEEPPDFVALLAQNIIDGADKFAQAATIIDDYTLQLAEYLERIGGFNEAMGPALKFEQDLAKVTEPGAKEVRPVAGAATLASTRLSSSEARAKMVQLLEEQNALLEKLDKDPDDSMLEEKLTAIVGKLDELIMRMRGGPGVSEASTWSK